MVGGYVSRPLKAGGFCDGAEVGPSGARWVSVWVGLYSPVGGGYPFCDDRFYRLLGCFHLPWVCCLWVEGRPCGVSMLVWRRGCQDDKSGEVVKPGCLDSADLVSLGQIGIGVGWQLAPGRGA